MLDVSALLRASFPSLSSDLLEYATSFITDLSPDEPEYNATIKDFIVPFLEGESIAVEDSVIDNLCAELSKLNIPKGIDESPGISVEIIPQTIKNQQDSAHEHLEPTPEPEHSPAPEKKSTAKSKNPRTKAAKISKSQQQSESSFLNEPEIIVTTQVSRYYSETFDADTIELDLPGVSITINGKDLLAEARLRLKTGYKYGLIGRNGVGKSTLLRAIGEKSMIGFPKNIKTLYVEQEAIGDENTNVIQSVLDSDHERIRVLRESDALEKAMKESNAHISKIYRKLLAQRAEDERYRAWEIAEKRSGARGWDARKVLLEKEKLAVAAAKYAEEEVSMEVADEEAEKANLLLNELYEKLTLIKAESTEAKVIEILNGLGFSKEKQTGPTSALSGGWRMRLSLARALFLKPDLLCLDEPTNHLDLPSVVWFQDYLKNHCDGQTVLIVSHDRAFMNEVIEEVILFQDMKLTYHSGNYDDFERNREERSLAKQKQQETLDRKMKHVEKSIENAMKSAVKSGDDKKLNQVSSRKKAIEKGRYGPTHFDDGKRFKQSYLAGYHDQFGLAIEQVKMEEEVNFKFPEPEPLRYLGPVLQVEGVSFKYKKSDPEFVLSNVTLNIERDCRIGIVGANGAGKSTLVNLILGELTPTVGTVTKHANLITGLYSQHDTNLLPTDISALAHMQSLFPGVKEQELRGILGSLGLKGKLATNPIITLSGGQKTRVSFAKTVFKSPNLLVLDEPTNHLDIESIKGLVRALETFSGGVIVVSHDVRFLKDTCKVFYVVEKGRVKRWEASVEDYAKSLAKQKMV
ncbi:hypothetical protein HK098_000891 [Nowakowskiella sp. JEL0407]|nr:hypothetical protein HK098_000891 [Nowakowskiella sp. JEL0407]